ncbi:MAG TPA: flippase activity-associated protein Agl23 [Thermoguttaceae bacterium]|nr:flippase activity-associated protein Agl23 [Thermoguttaceae bacterium]
MKSPVTYLALLLLVAAGALAFRLPRLADRPMHADEAVQAAVFRTLWLEGRYVYNPEEFHGPTLPYATLPSVWISGPATFAQTGEATYRVVPALFGAGLVLLLWLLGDAVGKPAALCAGVLTAISPALVFYSRDYIHETLLVFFTLAAIAAGWRYARSGKPAWCLAAGACVGLMQATKETCVLVYLAMGIGLACAAGWRWLVGESPRSDRPATPRWHLAAGLAAAILVAVTLLSSFFTNPRGPMDGLLTYLPWLTRAGGQTPHVHPWNYYLHVLAWWRVGDGPLWSEGLVLGLAAVGFAAALLPSRVPFFAAPFVRWLGFYTLALAAMYSALPYKTPWCLLGFLHGMILLAGVGAVALVRAVPTLPLKGCLSLVLLAAAGQLAWQSYRASYVLAADPRNPYVYAQTLPDAARLAGDVEQLAAASPDGRRVLIHVVWQDAYYWPLPWCLRGFERVGYWTGVPDDPGAPIVISSPRFDAALTERIDSTHLMTGYYGVRPNVLAQVWVRMDLWEAHLRRLGRL